MKKKLLLIIVAILVIAVVIFGMQGYLTGEGDRAGISDVTGNVVLEGNYDPVNVDESEFEFEGYAVGKSHIGTFDLWEGKLFRENGVISGFEGEIIAESVNTGIERLDTHLKSEDFFIVEEFPKIHFVSDSIEEGMVSGQLTFLGITKEVSFPVVVSEEGISADFFLDMTPFNMKYIGVNKEVRIAFDIVE